jgi:hypothetical protein
MRVRADIDDETTELVIFLREHPDCSPDMVAMLEREEEYFAKTLRRHGAASEAQRVAWRRETVFERRLRVSREVYEMLGGKIAHGPMKGVQLVADAWWGAPDKASMLLGLYEQEVLDALIGDLRKDRPVFIDVGAADGYYAVGLAKGGFYKKCYCFEISEKGRTTIAENARQNDVAGRINIFGAADAHSFRQVPEADLSQAVILIDVEGAEFDILTDECLRQLARSILVIEIHNWTPDFPGKYYRFLRWASAYFDISILPRKVRDLTGLTELDDFTDDNRYLICSEGRPNVMRFLVLKPKEKVRA